MFDSKIKRLTEVFQTPDGKVWGTHSEATYHLETTMRTDAVNKLRDDTLKNIRWQKDRYVLNSSDLSQLLEVHGWKFTPKEN